MSEYQYLEFRAVDRPLTDAELAFANKQSTRAEISRWSFKNEYHFGDFHGNVNGLLSRGYDVHFHYANYGIRKVAFRLPTGLPFPKSLWAKYIGSRGLSWKAGKRGKAGILSLHPYVDMCEIEELWELGHFMDEMVEVRARLLAGDPRALYLLWLCSVTEEEEDLDVVREPPVPDGLAKCLPAFGPFLDFFGIDQLVLAAAAEGAREAPSRPSQEQMIRQWVQSLNSTDAKRLLEDFLSGETATTKVKTIATILNESALHDWPCVSLGHTYQELLDRDQQLRVTQSEKDHKKRAAAEKRKAVKKERERQDRMKLMVKDPRLCLRKKDDLVAIRGTENYEAAAEILSDLREALKGDTGASLTRTHATHLVKKHPTLSRLKSSLRKRNLWG